MLVDVSPHPRAVIGASALVSTVALTLMATPAHAATVEPSRQGVPRPVQTPPPATHTVASGESVAAIAARYGLATADVLSWNGLSWENSLIRPGQVLSLVAPIAAAPAPAPAPAPATAGTSYTVVAGDTISGIAGRHGSTAAAVLAANGLTWDSIIYPGQTVTVPAASAPAAAPAPAAVAPAGLELDAEQAQNARTIIRVGREMGVPERGIAIALGTAMQESWLRNLDWGDRDSQGLFQQRPSTGWGTIEEVRDAERATRAFFGGPADPNGNRTRGLLDIPGWESMAYADAAQAVQISAYPDRYARWEQPSLAWLAALG
ncbi:LysM peptidoglycan-binding domain-containing protein [Microbacterium sp. RG1]|uniref:LysM peptidoglycan-binding domain-containing protein n=1 Tax=Microbacterium sp. RG1 TaxID=2489212 RepID=UPI0010CA351A|nr:LysM domain-containing protein [Microbacterium sp. RG1]QCQ15752.1 LysM domain-containing protein [Microbacterium sp. RG1]